MTTPSLYELWVQAGEDGAEYRRLLRERGILLSPGDPGYDKAPRTLPCGWPGLPDPAAWCEKSGMLASSCAHCRGITGEPDHDPASLGTPFTARYEGCCAWCRKPFPAGEVVRRDEDGNGYACEGCWS